MKHGGTGHYLKPIFLHVMLLVGSKECEGKAVLRFGATSELKIHFVPPGNKPCI